MALDRTAKLNKILNGISELFNESELQDLCFELDVDYESLSGDNKRDKARNLISYFSRRQLLANLIDCCKRNRPEYDWPDIETAPPDEEVVHAVEQVDSRVEDALGSARIWVRILNDKNDTINRLRKRFESPNMSDWYAQQTYREIEVAESDFARCAKTIIDYSEKGILIDNNNAWLFYYRGLGYLALSDYNKAVDDFSTAIQLQPSVGVYYSCKAYAMISRRQSRGSFYNWTSPLEPSEIADISRTARRLGIDTSTLPKYLVEELKRQ